MLRISDLQRQPVGQVRVAAMVLIHNMDSDEEQLQIVSYEESEAYAATSHSENRMGIKMTPKVPNLMANLAGLIMKTFLMTG